MTAKELRDLDVEVHQKVMQYDLHFSADYQDWFWVASRDSTGVRLGTRLPKYSIDMAQAWAVHRLVCGWSFSRRQQYFASLQDQASAITNKTNRQAMAPERYADMLVMWPDVLCILVDRMPEAICRAALVANGEQKCGD